MQENTKRRGNPALGNKADGTGTSGNPAGRPKVLNPEKKTNKEIRNHELLLLLRKFKPHISKAIMTAVDVMGDEGTSENGKLKAAALVIGTYKDLIKEAYDYRYDLDEGEEIQQNNAPVLMMTMLDGGKDK